MTDQTEQSLRSATPAPTESMEVAVAYGATLVGTMLDHLGSFETEAADQIRLAHRHLSRARQTHAGLPEALQTAVGLLGTVDQRVQHLGRMGSPHRPDAMATAQLGFILRRLEQMQPSPSPVETTDTEVAPQGPGLR